MNGWMDGWMDGWMRGCSEGGLEKKTKRYSEKEGFSLDGFVTAFTCAGRHHRKRCR
jgi:hypothetical protein